MKKLRIVYLNNISNLKDKIIKVEDQYISNCIAIIIANHKLFNPDFIVVKSGIPTHEFHINDEGYGEIISIK